MKISNLFNVKMWFQNFILKMILNKSVKHGVTAVIGVIAGAKVQELLTQFGISVDMAHFQAQLTVAFGAAAGAFINWAQRVLDPDGDGKLGKLESPKA